MATELKESSFFAGDYRADVKIGEGGMGEVWRGYEPKIKKKVAIKVLNKKLLGHDVTIARFKREALAVNTVRNRHIVDIFATGELEDGRPYMVMEYLDGVTLAQHLKKKGPLPFTEILELFGQLCKGLQAAHEAGIIHRDLKPDNIFLVLESGEKPFLKILDFGIAKVAEGIEDEDQDLTAANTAFGTPAYMSPEQCKGAKDVDHRTDIYALGIILYKLITGRTPFAEPGEGRMAIMIKQTTITAALLSESVTGRALPEGIEEFMQKVLAKYPGDRPTSCIALFDQFSKLVKSCWSPALDDVEGSAPIYKTKPSGGAGETSQSLSRVKMTGVQMVPPRKPTSPFQWLAVVVALLVLGVVAGTILFPHQLENPNATNDSTSLAALQPKTNPNITPASTSQPQSIPQSVAASQPTSITVRIATTQSKFKIFEIVDGKPIPRGTTATTLTALPPLLARDEPYLFVLKKNCYEDIKVLVPGNKDFAEVFVAKKLPPKFVAPKNPINPGPEDVAVPFTFDDDCK